MKRTCWSCAHIYPYPNPPAFAIWIYSQTNFEAALCKKCLDHWLDNADDDESLEPTNVIFL